MRRTRLPKIAIINRQKIRRLDLPAVRRVVREASLRIPALDTAPRARESIRSRPSTLDSLSIVFVTDAEIAGLNEQFLDHRGPTDVITFQHGEIIISIERAIVQARQLGTAVHDELALYLIHGLLHLAGHDDTIPAKRGVMVRRQRAVLREIRNKLDLRGLFR